MNNHARTTKHIKRLKLKSFFKRKIKPGKLAQIVNLFLNNIFTTFKTSHGGGNNNIQKRNQTVFRVEQITKNKRPMVYNTRFKNSILIGKVIYINSKPFRVVTKLGNYENCRNAF